MRKYEVILFLFLTSIACAGQFTVQYADADRDVIVDSICSQQGYTGYVVMLVNGVETKVSETKLQFVRRMLAQYIKDNVTSAKFSTNLKKIQQDALNEVPLNIQ